MKKFLFIISFCILIFPLFAQNRTIRVASNLIKDEQTGRLYGYEYEYFQELAKYTGWNYEFVSGDKHQFLEWLKTGYVDIIPERYSYRADESLLKSSEPIINLTYYIFKHSENRNIFKKNISSLNATKIGVVNNSAAKDFLKNFIEENNLSFEIITFPDIDELKTEFLKKDSWLDAVCISDYYASSINGISSVCIVGTKSFNALFSSKNRILYRDFNFAQQQLYEDKPFLLRKLKEKYFEFKNPKPGENRRKSDWVKTHNVISIGYAAGWYPFCSVGKDGEAAGVLPVYVNKLLEVLELSDIKVNYIPYTKYSDALEALKDRKINLIFPVYGDYYESEKNGIQKTDNITEMTLSLIYQGQQEEKKLNTIYNRTEFGIYDNYINQFLPDYNHISKNFTFKKELKNILKSESNAIIVYDYSADNLIRLSDRSNLYKIALNEKCPVAFGVRREDTGLLNLLDSGIDLIESDFINNEIESIIQMDRKYTIRDFIHDNLLTVYIVSFSIAILVIGFMFMYLKTIQKTKKQLEQSKKEVDEAYQRAEIASQAKSNFLNNMSHDIRTPMNAIIGFTKLARDNLDNTTKAVEYLSKLEISSEHLLDLINDVLDMSRIESGKLLLVENEENIIDIANNIKTILESEIKIKNIDFQIDTDGIKNPDILCDKLRINQILLNLLGNAVKFTDENGSILLRIKELGVLNNQKAAFQITVKDNGIGMSEEFQKSVFVAFEREKSSSVSKIEGAGLGLSITKKLVEMMGGSISVKSKKNQGTEFTVNIRFPIVQNKTVIEKETVYVEVSADAIRKCSKGKTLLVAEDNELNQEIARTILEELGFGVEIASNGKIAVDLIENNSNDTFSGILMDIQMPEMDGYEATKKIRQMPDKMKADIPIVAMTANAFEEDRKNSHDIGMNAHLAKPLELTKLMEVLLNLFSNKSE